MKIPKWMLQQSASVEAYTGSGPYGAEYADPVTISCRIEYHKTKTMDNEGNEVVSKVRLICGPDVTIPPESKVTYDGTEYQVVDLQKYQGLKNKTHQVAVLL